MNFTAPLPFEEVLRRSHARGVLPTELNSAEIGRLHQGIIDRSVLSARCNSAAHLQVIQEVIDDLLSGKINKATARARIQDSAEALGYDPLAGGFRGENAVEPAEPGSLQDQAGDARVNLILETQVSQMRGYGAYVKGQTAAALAQFPALELVREFPREVPRGLKRAKGGALVDDPGHDWPSRWEKAGGQFFGGRMIARKDDPVWEQLGSRDLFRDGLGAPYAPFAFNSGFRTRPVPRAECLALGVIAEGDRIEGTTAEMNADFQVAAKFDPEFLRSLQAGLDVQIADGFAKLRATNPQSVLLKNRARVLLALLRNMGTHEGALKGWDTRGRRVQTAERKKVVRAARAEVKRSLREKRDVRAAMHVEGLGPVDFVHGRPGTWKPNLHGATHADGYGLSHIVAKHGARAALQMPEVLATGKVAPHASDPAKRVVRSPLGEAVVAKPRKGRRFVVTSYDPAARTLGKTDRAARIMNQKSGPAEMIHRPYGEDVTGAARPGATRASGVLGSVRAGASEDFNFAPGAPEVKR